MRFIERYRLVSEKFIENNIGTLYKDSDGAEFWKHVVPDILGDRAERGDSLGAFFSKNHVFYFDRTQMEHPKCFRNFVRGHIEDDSLDNILPAAITKKGFLYIIRPAFYTLKDFNFMGYNDAKPKGKENQVQAFLKQGGMAKIQKLVDEHPHLNMLKHRTPLGYTIKVDFSEGLY